MRLGWVRWGAVAALWALAADCIILPDEADRTGDTTGVRVPTPVPTPAAPTPVPDVPAPAPAAVKHVHVIEDDDDTSGDIAENVAELDVELDRVHSKEVQDSDGGQRMNYASKDSGATVLDHAPGTKGSVNLLVPDKDRYMLIPCANDKKWVVIGLSEDIHADAIVVANYEKFSSPIREFLILGSLSYPSETWIVLGNFTTVHKSGEQLFDFHEKHHVRYIKLRMMSHYGSEYYCTMSQVKVHGLTLSQVISQLEKETIDPPSTAVVASPVSSPTPPPVAVATEPAVCPRPRAVNIFLVQDMATKNATTESESCVAPRPSQPTSPSTAGNATTNATTTNATKPVSHVAANHSAVEAANVAKPEDDKPPPPATGTPAGSGSGLDNFYIRMSKKLQSLESNLSGVERAMHEWQKNSGKDMEQLQGQVASLVQGMDALKLQVETELTFLTNASNTYAALLHAVHQDNMALRVEVQLLWDVIRTMKAGIMVAIILSAALIVFFLCRWVFRCLSACHRRAARREWFRRLDAADTDTSDAADDDLDINPLTHPMNHRVDRKLRFGTSYDDGAIQRNTMYRRIVNGFRQHHVQTTRGKKGLPPTRRASVFAKSPDASLLSTLS
ncbi:Aste57867_14336 [Aphanomyces stellatus]|uniref:Aste57867_14336 protein n=1 Tax=Aphanomyces stellatus TaxID=120398 RepID=A0A485L0C9_9STRA|nr:hypothetical protein As57867_014282 [Aphanomyces stellatus]VFT91160.1 Aste57867_14336 [Aphanomyces stellatus]